MALCNSMACVPLPLLGTAHTWVTDNTRRHVLYHQDTSPAQGSTFISQKCWTHLRALHVNGSPKPQSITEWDGALNRKLGVILGVENGTLVVPISIPN